MTDIVPAPAAPPAPPPAPIGDPALPWYQGIDGVDQEVIGHLQTKGWHNKPAASVAIEAVKAHREAERLIGAPASQIVRLPNDPGAPEWNQVWQRLGKPIASKDYDFSRVTFEDGGALTPEFSGQAAEIAHRYNLPKDAAAGFLNDLVRVFEKADNADADEKRAAVALERDELARSWGNNFEANKFVAQNAARALGIEPETVATLEGAVGYAKVMEMFRSIGQRIGEDRYISGAVGGRPEGGVMTVEQAIAAAAELKADKEWVRRYLDGGKAENDRMTALNTIISNRSRR